MMKKILGENSRVFRHPFIFTALFCLLSAALFDYSADGLTAYSKIIVFTALAALIALGVRWKMNGELTPQRIAFLIIAGSFLVKLIYVLCTGLGERQHDVGAFKTTSAGHAGRILRASDGEILQENMRGQSYHPPLHYILEGLWLKLLTLRGTEIDRAENYVTVLTLFYSCCVTLVGKKIFDELKMSDAAKNVALALVAFHLTFIILSASYNNDLLSILLLLVALLFALKWYNQPNVKNIIPLALGIGCGMMSKLSAAYIAPAVAVLFILKLITEKEKRLKLIGQYAAFGAVCVPLGTWWSVYLYTVHDKPFGYVMKLSDKLDQYIGFRTVSERLFAISHSFSEGIWFARADKGYTNSFFEYNIPSAILKTSVFGEWDIGKGNGFTEFLAYALFFLNIAIIAFSLYCMVMLIIKKHPGVSASLKTFLYILWTTIMGLFVKFCFDYPHNCTMDFRYIVPTVVTGAIFIGAYLDICKSKAVKYAVCAVTAAFCLAGSLLYVLAA